MSQIKMKGITYLPMNDNEKFDIDMANANIQIDGINPFSDKELPSINLFNSILRSKIEMKSHMQSLKTGNLFIEFEIDNRGDGNKKDSGLSKTEADYYFLNIDEMGIFLTTTFLHHLYAFKEDYELEVKDNTKTADDHIGYGLIIPMYRLMELYMNYYQFKLDTHLKSRLNEIAKNFQKSK